MLNQERLTEPERRSYVQAIEGFLEYCRLNGVSVRVGSAQDFVSDALRRKLTVEGGAWKEGLNWYFREGRKHGAPRPPGV